MIRLLAVQGGALAAVAVLTGIRDDDIRLVVVGVAVALLRAGVFPRLLASKLRRGPGQDRESTPLLNTSSVLLLTAALTTVAFVVTRPLVALVATVPGRAVPAAFAVVLIGVMLLVTRRAALSQVTALVVIDNGIDAVAFLAIAGVPTVVELGASLDVLLALVILVVLTGRLWAKFASDDLDDLTELADR
jgi:hydrogenase-4 component E